MTHVPGRRGGQEVEKQNSRSCKGGDGSGSDRAPNGFPLALVPLLLLCCSCETVCACRGLPSSSLWDRPCLLCT